MRNTTSYELPTLDDEGNPQFITIESCVDKEGVIRFSLHVHNQERYCLAEWKFELEDLIKFIYARQDYVNYHKKLKDKLALGDFSL